MLLIKGLEGVEFGFVDCYHAWEKYSAVYVTFFGHFFEDVEVFDAHKARCIDEVWGIAELTLLILWLALPFLNLHSFLRGCHFYALSDHPSDIADPSDLWHLLLALPEYPLIPSLHIIVDFRSHCLIFHEIQ